MPENKDLVDKGVDVANHGIDKGVDVVNSFIDWITGTPSSTPTKGKDDDDLTCHCTSKGKK